ncbi:protein FAM227B [Spea bombifrons]|uniref:protein FAM227B n=1 Tax=Spea bombifrons TaxID=233779 RepID=UPI00234BBC26|nr:protein FAM227B [Spea bombifrons]
MKDLFFTLYPSCLSQSIYAVFYEAFPESRLVFNEEFKSEIVDLFFQWVSGIKPMPYSWAKWDLNWLEKTNPFTVKNHKKTPFMDIAQTNLLTDERKKLDFNLDDLIQEARGATIPREVEENGPVTESHCIGPGPEFCDVLFDLGGHSPLVSNYLKMHKLTTYVPGGKRHKLKHTEIRKLPYPLIFYCTQPFTQISVKTFSIAISMSIEEDCIAYKGYSIIAI